MVGEGIFWGLLKCRLGNLRFSPLARSEYAFQVLVLYEVRCSHSGFSLDGSAVLCNEFRNLAQKKLVCGVPRAMIEQVCVGLRILNFLNM